jgi:hypothetical protein
MRHKFIRLAKIILLVIICVAVGLFCLKKLTTNVISNNYLKDFVKIESYRVVKDAANQQARLDVVITNSADRLIGSLPLTITYYDKNKRVLGNDYVDILKVTKDIILARTKKMFTLTILYPKESEYITPEIR